MALIIDAGVLLAALNKKDSAHSKSLDLLESTLEPRIVPSPVLVEVDQLLGSLGLMDVWVGFCRQVESGLMRIHDVTPSMILRAAELQSKYRDHPIGYVDAAVFVTCELLGESKVATLDHRHFSVLRTESGKALELLP